YGFGYTGNGYWGGRWSGNTFQYNTAVTRVNTNVVHSTYVNNSFTQNVNANRTSFNGGNDGIKAEPNAEQRAAMANARKEGPTSQQSRHRTQRHPERSAAESKDPAAVTLSNAAGSLDCARIDRAHARERRTAPMKHVSFIG